MEVSASLMKIDDKLAMLVIARDITERKQMEEKLLQYSKNLEAMVEERTKMLKETHERLQALVQTIPDVVCFKDAQRRTLVVNRAYEKLTGLTQEEIVGKTDEQLLPPDLAEDCRKSDQEVLRKGKILRFEEQNIDEKGEKRFFETIKAPLYDSWGNVMGLVGVSRDITKHKRMEQQLLKSERLAAIGELATMVAHDLRNPLTSIRNASFYIKNSCPSHAKPECKTAIEMFDIIEQGTLFANNIINDLLDFAAKRPLRKEKQDINKIVDSAITISNIPENIKIERNFAKKAIATVDEKQLQRVFLNLTRNAVQAMPDGGKLTVKTSETKDHIEIAFTNTGIGIQEENMSKIFQPLFTTKAKGICMGLAICKRIIEEHGGTIAVKSKVDQGTSFTVKLPKKEEANNQ